MSKNLPVIKNEIEISYWAVSDHGDPVIKVWDYMASLPEKKDLFTYAEIRENAFPLPPKRVLNMLKEGTEIVLCIKRNF